MTKNRKNTIVKHCSRLVLMLFVMSILVGSHAKQHVLYERGISIQQDLTEDVTFTNTTCSYLSSISNYYPSFDWSFGEVVIDFPSQAILNLKLVSLKFFVKNVFHVFISTNAP